MDRAIGSEGIREPTSLSEVGLRVCVELEKHRRHGFDQERWGRISELIRTLLKSEVCATNELRYLVTPSSSGGELSFTLGTYHSKLEQVGSAMTAISENPASAPSQTLDAIIDACWQMHRLLLQAQWARLSGDY